MMGTKSYQEKIFYNFSLSEKIPENHLLRRLDKVVDLRFVRNLVADKYSYTGQHSIAPEVIFKMMLVGYLYGITSERRLAEDISLNMAYMWYLGYDLDETTPNHSVISKARSRYGKDVFEEFFRKILQKCLEAGLISGEKIFADSTIIRADASLKSIGLRPEAVKPPYLVKEYIEKVFAENPLEQEADQPEKPADAKKETGFSNKTHVSRTDPEASIVSHGQKLPMQLGYKEHFTVDSKARVITAVLTTPAAVGDEAMLAGLISRQPVPVREIGADSKYGTFDNYQLLLKNNIRPAIPPWLASPPSKGHFVQNKFNYDHKTDTYTCPTGKTLKHSGDPVRNSRWTYYAKKRDCNHCSIRSQCISPTLQKRRVYRHIFHDARDKALAYLETEQAKAVLYERKMYAEWVNAESKTRHGLRRAMFRGLKKVSIQVLMTATVQNIKRLVKYNAEIAPNIRNKAGQFLAIVKLRWEAGVVAFA